MRQLARGRVGEQHDEGTVVAGDDSAAGGAMTVRPGDIDPGERRRAAQAS